MLCRAPLVDIKDEIGFHFRLILFEGYGFDAIKNISGGREVLPPISVENVTSKGRHEIPAPTGVAGGKQCNGSDSVGFSITAGRAKSGLDIVTEYQTGDLIVVGGGGGLPVMREAELRMGDAPLSAGSSLRSLILYVTTPTTIARE